MFTRNNIGLTTYISGGTRVDVNLSGHDPFLVLMLSFTVERGSNFSGVSLQKAFADSMLVAVVRDMFLTLGPNQDKYTAL